MNAIPLTVISVELPKNGEFDIDGLVESLSRCFPEFSVTCEDSFERQRVEAEARVEKIMRDNERFTKPELILGSLENKRLALGPGVDVQLSKDREVHVEGHIWRKSMSFRSTLDPGHPLIQELAHWLSENVAPTTVT